jgi:RimJ/RimL family protein N-acetyltransferase
MSEWERFGSIETERLVLRPISLDDVDCLVGLDSDPEVMRFLNGGKPNTREYVESRVRASIGYRWVAFTRSDRDFVGWYGMKPAGERAYELGYRLRQKHWGQGLAVEGSQLLIELAFTELGAERVCANTMTVNERSRRVMEKCGLRRARTYHLEWDEPIAGAELGDVEYELLRENYA